MLAAAVHSDIGTLIVVVGVVIATPTSVLAILGIKDRTERREERRINTLIARQLVGEHGEHASEPSPDNPSIRDLLHDALEETAAASSRVALVEEMLRVHVSDRHGQPIPDYLMRQ